MACSGQVTALNENFKCCIGKKLFRESIMEKGYIFMALSSYRTERKFETEITAELRHLRIMEIAWHS